MNCFSQRLIHVSFPIRGRSEDIPTICDENGAHHLEFPNFLCCICNSRNNALDG